MDISGHDMTAEFFIGKWTSIDSATNTIIIYHFPDKENVTISFHSEKHISKYTLEKRDGLTIDLYQYKIDFKICYYSQRRQRFLNVFTKRIRKDATCK